MLDYQFLRCTFSYNLVMESIYEEQWVKSFVWTLGIVQSCFLSFFLLHATTDCPWGTTFLNLRTQLTVKVIVIDLLKINHRTRYLGELPTQLFHAASVKRMWRRLLWMPTICTSVTVAKMTNHPLLTSVMVYLLLSSNMSQRCNNSAIVFHVILNCIVCYDGFTPAGNHGR